MASKYKTAAQLTDVDAAYIAGLVDGEGTITLSRRHRDDTRQLVVSISNTDFALLDYVRHTAHVGKITRKRTASARHTPSATYAVSNRQAPDLLQQLSPYLRTYKKRRAELILKHYVKLTPRNGKYTAELRAARRIFEARVMAIKPT